LSRARLGTELILEKCVVITDAGSYSRLIDSCISQLKAQGPSGTCNESKEEGEEDNCPHGQGGGRLRPFTSTVDSYPLLLKFTEVPLLL